MRSQDVMDILEGSYKLKKAKSKRVESMINSREKNNVELIEMEYQDYLNEQKRKNFEENFSNE